MKFLILALGLIIGNVSFSQTLQPEAILSASGNVSSTYASISWTLGDIQTLTYREGGVILTQGFLQSELKIISSNQIVENGKIEIKVFPNPVIEKLNIEMVAVKSTKMNISLHSLNGSLIFSRRLNSTNSSESIDFRKMESGTYILKVLAVDNSFMETFKILYQK